MEDNELVPNDDIGRRIIIIRNRQVMIDRDLADIYDVKTGRLNEQVKRNKERFPEDFCFQLTKEEQDDYEYNKNANPLISQNATSKKGGNRKLSYAFTEQGVAMLASVLKTKTAVEESVKIIRAFVAMRHFIIDNAKVFTEIESLKHHMIETDLHVFDNERRINEVFLLMDKNKTIETQGIFNDGQIFDSYVFISNLIKKATKEIILIDNYIDENVLTILNKRNENVTATIYTSSITKNLKLDLEKHNSQYPLINIKVLKKFHDRFLIIDDDVYHIGASIKDLGKRVFAFSKMEIEKEIIMSLL